jgi:hypothetical protein
MAGLRILRQNPGKWNGQNTIGGACARPGKLLPIRGYFV